MSYLDPTDVSSWVIRGEDGWPIWPPTCPAIRQAVEEVLQHAQWGNYHADVHASLIDRIAAMHQTSNEKHVLQTDTSVGVRRPFVRLCSSGTAAIELSLRGLGMGGGNPSQIDEVVVAAYDYPGNFRTIELLGAKPVLVDVVAGGVTMDPESLRQVDSPHVKAVIVSHLYGHLADIARISSICRERNWLLIEDACQVPGAKWLTPEPQTLGTLADATTLSFGGSKLLSAGNGGAIVTNNPRLIAKLNQIIDRPSDTYALSALQAAVLLPQLEMLLSLNAVRHRGAEHLRSLPWHEWQASLLLKTPDNIVPAFYKVGVLLDEQVDRHAWLDRFTKSDFLGLPNAKVGEGFRSTHATSDRRSKKPVELTHSARLDQRLVVLDHRVLLHFGHDPKNT